MELVTFYVTQWSDLGTISLDKDFLKKGDVITNGISTCTINSEPTEVGNSFVYKIVEGLSFHTGMKMFFKTDYVLGNRYNSNKPKWSLVDYESLLPLVQVLEFGASKYGENNWKKGLSYTETTESLLRHVYSFLQGEDTDEESKLHHIGHILCNAMFLSYMIKNRPNLDDRRSQSNCAEV